MAISDTRSIIETYNYESFSRSESAGKSNEFRGALRAGEEAPGFELPTLNGDRIRLSALRWQKACAARVWEHYLTAFCGRGLAPKRTLPTLSRSGF